MGPAWVSPVCWMDPATFLWLWHPIHPPPWYTFSSPPLIMHLHTPSDPNHCLWSKHFSDESHHNPVSLFWSCCGLCYWYALFLFFLRAPYSISQMIPELISIYLICRFHLLLIWMLCMIVWGCRFMLFFWGGFRMKEMKDLLSVRSLC